MTTNKTETSATQLTFDNEIQEGGLGSSTNPRSNARKRLSRCRHRLKKLSKERSELEKQYEQTNDHRKREKIKAKLNMNWEEESRVRGDIERYEGIMYGDWTPKQPPTPERMQEIRASREGSRTRR